MAQAAAGAQAAPDQALIDALGEDGVRNCLQICGLTQDAQRNEWISEGMTDMNSVTSIRPSEVYKVAKKIESRSNTVQGQGNVRKVKAFIRWCLARTSMGMVLDSREFTAAEMNRVLAQVTIEEDEKDAGIEPAENTVKFRPAKWVAWKLGFQTALRQIRGVNNLPLSYVIRDQGIPPNFMTLHPDEQRQYMVQLAGPQYSSDNKTVWSRLKMELLETEGWPWIKECDRSMDGRAAWLALCAHYDGPNQKELRIAEAYATLHNLVYKSERHGMKFEKYVTKIKDACQTLKDNGINKNPSEEVDYLLAGIEQNAPEYLRSAKVMVKLDPVKKNNFTEAANALSQIVGTETSANASHGQRGGRKVSAIGRGGGRGQGGGRGRGGRGRGRGGRGGRGRGGNGSNDSRTSVGGVDVTDPTRNFSSEEYGTLIGEGYIETLKRRRREARGGGGGDDTSTAVSSLRTENETLQARIAALEGAYRGQSEANSQSGGSDGNGNSSAAQSNGTAFGAGAYKRARHN